jgi:predicted HTH transcriptional regulator
MSIYSKQINSIAYSDLLLLLDEGAKENIRLEFKREYPSKDEILKKISSLANTWGGYIIIGVEQDSNGRASTLVGVEPKSGFQQQIIEWCYGGIYPPISPLVSAPIQKAEEPARVFYVIYVLESYDAPHFLNGRKGCYIRTDEFSQSFEPRLATYDEILHLSERRQTAISKREKFIARARSRFDSHVEQSYGSHKNVIGNIDFTMWIAIIPTFPPQTPVDISV